MGKLSNKEDAIYTKLVKEYNDSRLDSVCSLDRFLKSKWENETDPVKQTEYYNVWVYASEDF